MKYTIPLKALKQVVGGGVFTTTPNEKSHSVRDKACSGIKTAETNNNVFDPVKCIIPN